MNNTRWPTKHDWIMVYWFAYYGVLERLALGWHWLKGHEITWRTEPEPDDDCAGDGLCSTCDVVFICRCSKGHALSVLACMLRGHIEGSREGWTRNGIALAPHDVHPWCRRCMKEI